MSTDSTAKTREGDNQDPGTRAAADRIRVGMYYAYIGQKLRGPKMNSVFIKSHSHTSTEKSDTYA